MEHFRIEISEHPAGEALPLVGPARFPSIRLRLSTDSGPFVDVLLDANTAHKMGMKLMDKARLSVAALREDPARTRTERIDGKGEKRHPAPMVDDARAC